MTVAAPPPPPACRRPWARSSGRSRPCSGPSSGIPVARSRLPGAVAEGRRYAETTEGAELLGDSRTRPRWRGPGSSGRSSASVRSRTTWAAPGILRRSPGGGAAFGAPRADPRPHDGEVARPMNATPQRPELAPTEDAFVFALLGLRSFSRRVERFVEAAVRGAARARPSAARTGETVPPLRSPCSERSTSRAGWRPRSTPGRVRAKQRCPRDSPWPRRSSRGAWPMRASVDPDRGAGDPRVPPQRGAIRLRGRASQGVAALRRAVARARSPRELQHRRGAGRQSRWAPARAGLRRAPGGRRLERGRRGGSRRRGAAIPGPPCPPIRGQLPASFGGRPSPARRGAGRRGGGIWSSWRERTRCSLRTWSSTQARDALVRRSPHDRDGPRPDGQTEYDLRDARAYHDHNWGEFRWAGTSRGTGASSRLARRRSPGRSCCSG